jgi:hypothetical protein
MSILNALTSGGGVALTGDTSGNLTIQSAGTNVATFTTGGNLNLQVSNAGINFNNSGAVGAATLNDYEVGTWTPTLLFGGGTTGITYSQREGRYTKIGNMVTCFCDISLSNKGSSTGNANISGLPFTPITAAGGNGLFGGIFIGDSNMSSQQSYSYILAYNDAQLYLRTQGSSAGVAVSNSAFTNSSNIYLSVTYQATF